MCTPECVKPPLLLRSVVRDILVTLWAFLLYCVISPFEGLAGPYFLCPAGDKSCLKLGVVNGNTCAGTQVLLAGSFFLSLLLQIGF